LTAITVGRQCSSGSRSMAQTIRLPSHPPSTFHTSLLILLMSWLTATLFTQWIGGINVDIYRKDCPQAVLILLADGKISPKNFL
jgi:hypothetical protein